MKQQKLNVLFLGFLLSVSSSIFADKEKINSGAYFGLDLGLLRMGGKCNSKFSTEGAPKDIYSFNSGLSTNSLLASPFVGFGIRIKDIWLAPEISYQFGTLKTKNSFRFNNLSADKFIESKSSGAWGGAVQIGYVINNKSIIYGILGAETRQFRIRFVDMVKPRDVAAEVNKKYRSIAFTPGIGSRLLLDSNLSVRLEYKCAMNGGKRITVEKHNSDTGAKDVLGIKYQPVIHNIKLGFVYNF